MSSHTRTPVLRSAVSTHIPDAMEEEGYFPLQLVLRFIDSSLCSLLQQFPSLLHLYQDRDRHQPRSASGMGADGDAKVRT